ncbi:MAG: hypothetical protein ABIJ28_04105 [Patescibacteria group bacterium]
MENRKFVKFLIFNIFVAMVTLPFFCLAYDNDTTHPALTDEAVDLFNYYYQDYKLTEQEKEIIKKGSKEEDNAPRWVNHFYDPVYNKGWLGNLTSKQWAQSLMAQSGVYQTTSSGLSFNYFDSVSDYSWERAVFEYADRDKNRGLLALGHVLHLIQDMSVPDNTRNDAHPPILNIGSPYEGWASRFTDENFQLAEQLIANKEKPIIFNSLDEYFDSLATYSNNNFFSKDTILIDKYNLPKIEGEKEIINIIFAYKILDNREVLLARKYKTFDSVNLEYIIDYSVKDEYDVVVSDYWRLLSRQAVLNSAGVIKLFFEEVEKEKQTLVLKQKDSTFFEKLLGSIFGSISRSIKSISTAFQG